MSDLESQFCHVALTIFNNLVSTNFFIFYSYSRAERRIVRIKCLAQ